jgi:hypothetical protein
MSLYDLINPSPNGHGPRRNGQRAVKVVVAPSDDEVRRILTRWRVIMKDGPVDVQAKLIGWRHTDAGPLGAIFANPLTNRRELWALDFATRRPRLLAVLA